MKQFDLGIDIQAKPEDIWAAIISDKKYRVWTKVFDPHSYFEGGWQKGDRIKFLSFDENGNQRGMVSEIAESVHLKHLSIRHLGIISNGVEDYDSDAAKQWAPAYEKYYLEPVSEGVVRFRVEADIDESEYDFFMEAWEKALVLLKQVCEENLAPFAAITIETVINAPVGDVWAYWTEPAHIVKWAFASDDWHCPKAVNDLRVGGHYATTMASKDGQMAFDFSGTYTEVLPLVRLVNQIDDGRMVWVDFEALSPQQTKVVETFEAEDMNSLELQREGWQAILNNFKIAVESA